MFTEFKVHCAQLFGQFDSTNKWMDVMGYLNLRVNSSWGSGLNVVGKHFIHLVVALFALGTIHAHAQTCVANIQSTTPSSTFVINTDGTVTDKKTNLVWDRCSWGQTGDLCEFGTATNVSWATALSVPSAANSARYKSYADWRVPNAKELLSIVELCRRNPAINEQVFPNSLSLDLWTSSQHPQLEGRIVILRGNFGNMTWTAWNNNNYVRLVRSGS